MFNCVPELSHPLPEAEKDVLNLHEKVAALFKTVEFLKAFGADDTPNEEDMVKARAGFHASITDSTDPSTVPANIATVNTAGSVMHLKQILSEYDHVVVKSAVQIRTYVTNKLIEESTNPDAKIRMRSLELLGKIGDVGLFIERSEITVKHKTTIELQASIKERISKLLQVRSKAEEIQDVPIKAVSLREAADDMLDETPVTLVVDNTKTDERDFRT